MKRIRIISVGILVITSFVSLDLLINLLGSMIPSMNDGIGVHSIMGNLCFADDIWTQEQFFRAFVTSLLISFAVFVENAVLAIIEMIKK